MSDNLFHSISIVDNVFVRMMKLLKKGDYVNGHAHTFDHITLLSFGCVKMEHDNGENVYSAPYIIVTPKGIKHKFTALEDNTTLSCIHAIRDGDGVEDIAPQNITIQEAHKLLEKYPLTV